MKVPSAVSSFWCFVRNLMKAASATVSHVAYLQITTTKRQKVIKLYSEKIFYMNLAMYDFAYRGC